MIANVFSKTRPLNYLIIGILASFFFFWKMLSYTPKADIQLYYATQIGLWLLILASIFLTDFITLKNDLTKGNNFALFLFFIFTLFFSSFLQNNNIVISNFLLLLALRRLISLKSLVHAKEKIFDASFWIFLAALFHFWSIFYIVLVFIAIVLHVSKDYRNWIVPFIALLAVTILFFLANSILDNTLMGTLLDKTYISFEFYNFESVYHQIALAVFTSLSLFAFVAHIFDLPNKSLNMQSSHKTTVFSFILAVGIYILSTNKNNGSIAFCFAPLAIIGANFLQNINNKAVKDVTMYSFLVLAVFFFVMQL